MKEFFSKQEKTFYFPNDLVQLLLSHHCASESGSNPDKSLIQPGDKVTYKNPSFKGSTISMNDYMSNWRVLDIIEDSYTGYLGIIYVNDRHTQLVLAHRSTNFKLSLLTENIVKESGLQVDIKGCVLGTIQNHQGFGYIATKKVVDLIVNGENYSTYSLSFTGYSLGAWLAELSVFYCHSDLLYDNVKAVTFDGPGSYDMMMLMCKSMIKGRDEFKLESLDIVTYLSSPNIVNCTNRHVGEAYRLPTRDSYNKSLSFLPDALLSIHGHHFDLIVEHFDSDTGKPRDYKKITKWPCISHSGFGVASNLGIGMPFLPVTGILVRFGITISHSVLSNVFDSIQNSTLGSMVLLFSDFWGGKLNTSQFWIAHEYLNINDGYIPEPKSHLSEFKLKYEGNYQVDVVNLNKRIVSDSIDNYLVSLKTQIHKGISKKLKKVIFGLTSKYNYEVGSKTILTDLNGKGIDVITVEYLRELVRENRQRYYDFKSYILNQHQPRFNGNLDNIPWNFQYKRPDEMELIKNSFSENKITILQGPSGVGKTYLAIQYASDLGDHIPILLNSSSTNLLVESLKEIFKGDMIYVINEDYYQSCHSILENNQQKILFILDDVKEFSHISKFVEVLSDIKSVSFIITTTNIVLVENKESKISIPFINGVINEASLLKLKKSLEIISQDIKYSFEILKVLLFINSPISKKELIKLSKIIVEDDFNLALESLQKQSFIELKDNIVSITHQEILKLVLEVSNFESLQEFIKYVTSFTYEKINFINVMKKLQEFDFQYLTNLVISLNGENPLVPYNLNSNIVILKIISKSLENNYNYNGEKVQELKELESSLTNKKYKLLQNQIDDILCQWPNDENQQDSFIYDQINGLNQTLYELINHINDFTGEIETDIENIGDEHTNVIILGNTGSGKSTIINGLIGNNIKYLGEDELGLIQLLPERKDGNPIIGNNGKSETKSVRPYRNQQKDSITYWDCPGFLDSDDLLSDIQNIFVINGLNEVIQKFKNFSLMIVIDHSSIIATRGSELLSLLRNFSKLVSFDHIKDKISIVVSKSPTKATKDTIKKVLNQIINDPNGKIFLDLVDDRIEVFNKPNQPIDSHYISNEAFQRINEMLKNKVRPGLFSIGIKINSESNNSLVILSGILNKIAETLVEKVIVNDINNVLKEYIETFTNGDLRAQIRERYSVPVQKNQNNNLTFFDYLKKISKQSTTSNYIEKISKILIFFSQLSANIKPEFLHWTNPINKLKSHYDKFTDSYKSTLTGSDTVIFESPIILISEINDFIIKNPSIKNIWSISYLCIVDLDLIINSGNIHIASNKFKIIGKRNIILKGVDGVDPSDSGKNGGNFYGLSLEPRDKNSINNLVIDVSGGNGKDGEFSQTIDENIKEIEKNIYQNETKLNFLKQYNPKNNDIINLDKKLIQMKEVKTYLESKLNNSLNEIKENESKETLFLPTSEKLTIVEKIKELKKNHSIIESSISRWESEIIQVKSNIENLSSFSILYDSIDTYIKMNERNSKFTNLESLKNTLEELNLVKTKTYDMDSIESKLIQLINTDICKNFFEFEQSTKEIKEYLDRQESIKFLNDFDLETEIQRIKDDIQVKENDLEPIIELSDQEKEITIKSYKNEIDVIGVEGYPKLSAEKLHELLKKYQEDNEKYSTELVNLKSPRLAKNLKMYNDKHQITMELRKKMELKKKEFETKINELTSGDSLITNKLLNEFKEQDKDLKDALKSHQDSENKFFEILSQKDIVIKNSSIIQLKKGKILKSYARLTDPQEYIDKAKKEKEKLDELFSMLSQKDGTKKIKYKNLDLILKKNYGLSLKYKFYSLKNDQSSITTIRSELNECIKELNEYWKQESFFVTFGLDLTDTNIFDTSAQYYKKKFDKKTKNLEIKLLLESRIQFAENNFISLLTAYKELSSKHKKLKTTKSVMEIWKSRQNFNKQHQILFKIYDDIQKLNKDIKISKIQENEAARTLLCDPINLKNSLNNWEINLGIENKNKNFKKSYQFYQITGPKGGKGGNSGSFVFKGFNEFQLSQTPGENGEHSLSLEGSYIENQLINNDPKSFIFSIPRYGLLFEELFHFLVSLYSKWIDGPYETQNTHLLEKPSQNEVNYQISELLQNNLNLYLSEIKDQINFIYPK